MSRCPVLETERLILRPFNLDDLDAYTATITAPEVRRSMHFPDTVGRFDAWNHMVGFLGQWELQGTGHWALEEKATGGFVGRAGLHRPERADWPGLECGWLLSPDHWGMGYATEAGLAAVRYAFDVLEVDELFSVILPENRASQAVARRLGFELVDERALSHFPAMAHGIWRLGDRSG